MTSEERVILLNLMTAGCTTDRKIELVTRLIIAIDIRVRAEGRLEGAPK